MKNQIEMVKEFINAFNLPSEDNPAPLELDRSVLRHKLLKEEVQELYEASLSGDLVGCADGIVDCLYIILGTAHELGMTSMLEELFEEVHKSNMSKLDNGKAKYRADGKVMKGKNYFKPNLLQILTASKDVQV
jgi:predicted HAD superfamily Cof-like phosphohydrolase